MAKDSYISRRRPFLKSFDRAAARSKHVLMNRYGDACADSVISQSRRVYENLIPQIPFIGHRSPFLVFLLPTSRYLAVYRVLQKMGVSVEEAGRLIYQMNEAELNAIPAIVRRMAGCLWFSPLFIWRVKKRAKESQERKNPAGYVLRFVEGDGRNFDYGIDYTECAGCKFLKEQGAPELAPYLCALDKANSERLGWGLIRTTTLARGGDKCDFRFKKGGETNVIS